MTWSMVSAARVQPSRASRLRPKASELAATAGSPTTRRMAVAIPPGSAGSNASSGITSSPIEDVAEPVAGTPHP